MGEIVKLVWKFLDLSFITFWAISTIKFVGNFISGGGVFDSVERVIQSIVMLSPVVYLWVRYRREKKTNILDNDIKREQLKKLKKENNKDHV